MRGTAACPTESEKVSGITPAHAGNRRRAENESGDRWDHPRSCGEQVSDRHFHIARLGSPPLMRGTEPKNIKINSKNRITPAHAGNSYAEWDLPTDE